MAEKLRQRLLSLVSSLRLSWASRYMEGLGMSEVIDSLIADCMTANGRSSICLRRCEGSFWRMIWQSRWDAASISDLLRKYGAPSVKRS